MDKSVASVDEESKDYGAKSAKPIKQDKSDFNASAKNTIEALHQSSENPDQTNNNMHNEMASIR